MKRMICISILLSIAAVTLFAQAITVSPNSVTPSQTTVKNGDKLYFINCSDSTVYVVPDSADISKWNRRLGRGTRPDTITIAKGNPKSYTISGGNNNDTLHFNVSTSSNSKGRLGADPAMIIVTGGTGSGKKSHKK